MTEPVGLSMVTVLRAEGLRVVIFVDDHEPAHVHVFGDGHAKIDPMSGGDAPGPVWAVGMSRGEFRLARQEKDVLLARWREIHG